MKEKELARPWIKGVKLMLMLCSKMRLNPQNNLHHVIREGGLLQVKPLRTKAKTRLLRQNHRNDIFLGCATWGKAAPEAHNSGRHGGGGGYRQRKKNKPCYFRAFCGSGSQVARQKGKHKIGCAAGVNKKVGTMKVRRETRLERGKLILQSITTWAHHKLLPHAG